MFDKNISAEKRESLEFAEESRETEWKYPSFALKLFHGDLALDLIHPFPLQSPEDKSVGDEYCARLKQFLTENLDPNEVDRGGTIPDAVIKGLGQMGAFAMKIPKQYGGLGLSQTNYNRAIHLVASYCASTAVLLSAHQSIGVPQPLKLFGTEEQKKKYFPMFARGVVSAFALTEPEAGSDPRNMTTTATPTEDGRAYLLNGEKLWCTNGLIAGVIVVMAVTPPKIIDGKERKQITAFILETNTPGFEIVHRCRFMGLNGIENGLIRFNNVRVPKENVLLGEGEGLKLALMTLNTGRLTLPAASTGVGKWCLQVARQWSRERVQWGGPIGEHESIALKLAYMASHTFAMDAVSWLTSAMADDKKKDIRLEAAIAKYFCTEHTWRIVDQTLQIRGGQGYERSDSLAQRGMKDYPIERVLRDCRINLIIEGTSEIMKLFVAREALDPHLSRVKPLLSAKTSTKEKLKALVSAAMFYPFWYAGLWCPALLAGGGFTPPLAAHMNFVRKASKALARQTFHQMLKYRTKLESRQGVLNRVVDIGTDLFVMSAVCSYADRLAKEGQERANALELADVFCRYARRRVRQQLKGVRCNDDIENIRLAKRFLKDEFLWLENDIIS